MFTVIIGMLRIFLRIMASISPLIAGYLYQNWGMTATLFFTAALFAISAVIFAGADLKSTRDAEVQASGK